MFWIWFLVVGVSSQAFPQSPSVGLYNKANAYYRIGDFESALRETVIRGLLRTL